MTRTAAPSSARLLRRALAIPIALALLLPLAANVSAARPTVFNVNVIAVDCGAEGNALGTAITGGFADDFMVSAYLDFWPAPQPPFEGPPSIGVYSTTLVSADEDGAVVTVELGDYVEDPEFGFFVAEPNQGTATITVVYNRGEPEVIDRRFKSGNINVREVGFHWELAPTVTVDGPEAIGDFTFDSCSGFIDEIEVWQTTPHAFVGSFESNILDCAELAGSNGSLGFIFAEEFSSGSFSETFFDIFVLSGEEGYFGSADITDRTRTSLSGVATLSNEEGSVQITATVDASFTELDTSRIVTRSQDGFHKLSETTFAVSGTMALSTGETFDLGSCSARSTSQRDIFAPSNRPVPKGPAPANDVLSGAMPIGTGLRNVQTGRASIAPEVEASCAPFGRTLWYTVTGTGGTMTIDSAGSDFDTVVAVYDAALNEVACSDDVPPETEFRSLQAAASFESVAGATYYVQVGGFDHGAFDPSGAPEWGKLRLTVS